MKRSPRPSGSVADATADTLRALVEHATPLLLHVTDAEAMQRPAPGAWSPKEIVGHLIDSASSNHQRFVRARFQDDLVFPGYDQDAWVEVQRYQDADWNALVGLWRAYNLHLARVIEAMPEATCERSHSRHNLHQIAWRTVPEHEPATLAYFMQDYVNHMRHHLLQVIPDPLGLDG